MFKQSSFQGEIYRSMEKTLVQNQSSAIDQSNRLSKAVNCLNDAVIIFRQAGMTQEASAVAQVLQDLRRLGTK